MRHLLPIIALCLLAACTKSAGTKEEGGDGSGGIHTWRELGQYEPVLNSHAGVTSHSNLTLIGGTYVQIPAEDLMMVEGELGVVYPRFVKTGAGDYLMFYHYGNTKAETWAGFYCSYARSADLVGWKYEQKLFKMQGGQTSRIDGKTFTRYYAGADLCALPDGRIMVVAATRTSDDMRHRIKDNGLAIRYSSDNGHSWTDDKIVYVGTNWEPKPLVLPDGTIQIYYTDSRPYVEGVWDKAVVSSGSSYIWSTNNGKSWLPADAEVTHKQAFKQVRVIKDNTVVYTDQMPAVIVLNGTTRFAAAMESDRGNTTNTDSEGKTSLANNMYVSLAWSGENYDWGEPDATGRMPEERADWFVKGASPYLAQFPSGETVLTYNDNTTFFYRLGDQNARNFGTAVRAFGTGTIVSKGFWGTIYVTGPNTIVAGVGGTQTVKVMQVGQFWLNHDIKAPELTVKQDGDSREWGTGDAFFCGSSSEAHMLLRPARDSRNLYLLAEILGEGAYGKIELGVGNALKTIVVQSYGLRSSEFKNATGVSLAGEASDGRTGFACEVCIPLSEFSGATEIPVRATVMARDVNDSFGTTSQAVAALPRIILR